MSVDIDTLLGSNKIGSAGDADGPEELVTPDFRQPRRNNADHQSSASS